MANQEHLDILKQGVKVWNQWREERPDTKPDLHYARLFRADLSNAHLSNADLSFANLFGANLSHADLTHANLFAASLNSADLRDAQLAFALLSSAYLSGAQLGNANLGGAHLDGAHLGDAILSEAWVGGTAFGDVDLRLVKGLEAVKHKSPSTIGIDTIIKSQGRIPEIFLRGAGVPPSVIEQIPALVGSLKPIDFYSCFISYSSLDQDFADRLYADLQAARVRCWFAPHDLKTGDRYRDRIEESIRAYDKLLLILSKNAVVSAWVEEEVEKALDKERQLRAQGRKQTVLFPIKLDDTVMQTTKAWAADVRRMWHIGDFIGWHDYTCYQRAFTRLLHDLKSEA